MDLSESAMKVLHDAKIYTIGDVIQLTKMQMLYLPGSNKHIHSEVDELIYSLGLEWRKEDDQ
ncbi:MAG: hypothetical protein MJZ74_07435 [Muribaculaceae bacterium]|nr:hypothetical protein [Muribaculaceae bacterium]